MECFYKLSFAIKLFVLHWYIMFVLFVWFHLNKINKIYRLTLFVNGRISSVNFLLTVDKTPKNGKAMIGMSEVTGSGSASVIQ